MTQSDEQEPTPSLLTVAQQQRAEALTVARDLLKPRGPHSHIVPASSDILAVAEWILAAPEVLTLSVSGVGEHVPYHPLAGCRITEDRPVWYRDPHFKVEWGVTAVAIAAMARDRDLTIYRDTGDNNHLWVRVERKYSPTVIYTTKEKQS